MEIADLNSIPPDDRQLEAWYRADISAAPLADDGFTDRVLALLPPSPQQSANKRLLFCLIGGLFGTATALLGIAQTDFNSVGHPDFPTLDIEMLTRLVSPELGLALALTAGCLWYVFRPRLNFLLRF